MGDRQRIRMRFSYILLFAAAACAMAASDHMEKDTVVPEESVAVPGRTNIEDVFAGVATTVGVENSATRHIRCGHGQTNYCAAKGFSGSKRWSCGSHCYGGYHDSACNCCCMTRKQYVTAEATHKRKKRVHRPHRPHRHSYRRHRPHRHRPHRHSKWSYHESQRRRRTYRRKTKCCPKWNKLGRSKTPSAYLKNCSCKHGTNTQRKNFCRTYASYYKRFKRKAICHGAQCATRIAYYFKHSTHATFAQKYCQSYTRACNKQIRGCRL